MHPLEPWVTVSYDKKRDCEFEDAVSLFLKPM